MVTPVAKKVWLGMLFIGGLILQVIWYGLFWGQLVASTELLTTSDYLIFYTGGAIIDQHGYPWTYDQSAQIAVQENILGRTLQPQELLPFNHPPLLLPLQALSVDTDYARSYLRWNGLNLFWLILIALGLFHLGTTYLPSRQIALGLSITGAFFYPIFISILKGQDTLVLVLGTVLVALGLVKNKMNLAGTGLALMTIRPQYALLLGIPFLFKNQKTLLWAGIATIPHVILFGLLGPEGIEKFLQMLFISARGEGYYLNRDAMFNLAGLLTRSGMDTPLVTNLTWLGFACAVFVLAFIWRSAPRLELSHLSAALILAAFFSPHLHYHDLALLLVPVLAVPLLEQSHRVYNAAFPLLVSLVFLLLDLTTLPRFIFPYLLMGGIFIWLWKSHFRGKNQPVNA